MRNIRNTSREIEGHLLTIQRQLLLNLLRDAGGHIDAKELYRRAISQDESISLATVYRGLHLFRNLGLVEERRLGKLRCCYEIKRSVEHQHLVCRSCGKIMEIETPLIQKLVDKVRREYNFDVTRAELCLEGYCPQCREKIH
jgi:Fe2+ or Zn2+ uptake regulation protein